ncbi:MAG: hypothetical protein KIS96_10245 [Bauldia sp.]|nr:hypothetical protein [Bauldia sp.]
MTICIAARSDDSLLLASDRMLTGADLQFEPPRTKIIQITPSIFLMGAGDVTFQTTIVRAVMLRVQRIIAVKPNEWVNVAEVVRSYVNEWNALKAQMAESAILAPLGINNELFIDRQRDFATEVARDIVERLERFPVPECSAIIAGKDSTSTQIFTIVNNEVTDQQSIGFACIGVGSRHAESEFMLNRYTWNTPLAQALLHTYVAKKKAEVAPGVGTHTDMVIVGPSLGQSNPIGDNAVSLLDSQYRQLLEAEQTARAKTLSNVQSYLDDLLRKASEQANAAAPVETQATGDGAAGV